MLKDSSIAFLIDIGGYIFASFVIECPIFKRKLSFILLNFIGFTFYLANGIIIFFTEFSYLIYLNRFINSSYFVVFQTYNLEMYPTLIRPHATSVNRLLSRIINVWTPTLMVNVRPAAYFLICSFMLTCGIFLITAGIEETKGKVIQEFPEEFQEVEKIDSNVMEKQTSKFN